MLFWRKMPFRPWPRRFETSVIYWHNNDLSICKLDHLTTRPRKISIIKPSTMATSKHNFLNSQLKLSSVPLLATIKTTKDTTIITTIKTTTTAILLILFNQTLCPTLSPIPCTKGLKCLKALK